MLLQKVFVGCTKKRSRDFHRIHLIGVSGGKPLRVRDKLPHHPKNNNCMLCGRPPTRRTGLCYHHWVIIDGIAHGIWLCCVCHMFAERYDHDYTPKYIKLKKKILRNVKGGVNGKGRNTT